MPTDVPSNAPSEFSYCRVDSDFALKLAEDLKAAGANVWIDQLDIELGTPWDGAVVDIPSQLIKLGLVDEFRFVVQPILVGEGRRLLEGVTLLERQQLQLVESKTFESGCVALRYLKQRERTLQGSAGT